MHGHSKLKQGALKISYFLYTVCNISKLKHALSTYLQFFFNSKQLSKHVWTYCQYVAMSVIQFTTQFKHYVRMQGIVDQFGPIR